MMKKLTLTVAVLMAFAGCDDVARESSPVELVATVTQDVQLVDLADPTCPNLGTVELRAIPKNPLSDETFLDVRLTRTRVSYRRTDGGTLRPSSFVRTISGLVPIGGTATLNTFRVFQPDAVNEAPFAALLPSNGGVDPETGRRIVQMDVILEIFGETLSGENVATSVSFPVDFCFNCGGCA